ncbi:NAD(P)H-binding protein [Bifidobacterium angulatum]|uniref:NAD(P)H-binding protein n=1 Tax=Bifidobacterium angulatum TaxID=1683 RepID=UPI00306C6850
MVFTMGAHDGPCMVEKVDYGAVRNTLLALDGRKVRIALMTAIGVTYMDTDYNRVSQAHDWKRRSERLVRASGNEYTIVRPGWFDYNDPDQQRLVFLQGDTHRHASPEDGVVSRKQIAQVLVSALGCETPTIRRWSSWPNAAPRRNNSTRFSSHWNRTIRIASTACTTRRTSPTAASPNAYAKTWPASPALRTRPSEPHVPHTTPARTTARL